MDALLNTSNISQIIQLAVAPVFLLAGIAGFLNVMSGRLGRIVDRSREVQRRQLRLRDAAKLEDNCRELRALQRRIRLNNLSIGFCTLSGLLVCILVVVLFLGSYLKVSLGEVIVFFFTAAMLTLIVALILFIQETLLATRTLRESQEFLDSD